MNPTVYRAMISSTANHFAEEREQARQACEAERFLPLMMELQLPGDETAEEMSRRLVEECGVYVLLLSHRYGSRPQRDRPAYTAIEMDLALQLRKPIIVLQSAPDARVRADSVERGGRAVAGLRKLVAGALEGGRIAARFNSPAEVRRLVAEGLRRERQQLARAPARPSTHPFCALIGSAADDLRDERAAARDACERHGVLALLPEREPPRVDEGSQAMSMRLVGECDIYVLLLGVRGLVAAGRDSRSLTEIEYEEALRLHKKTFVLGVAGDAPVRFDQIGAAQRMTEMLQRLRQRAEERGQVASFSNCADVGYFVGAAIKGAREVLETARAPGALQRLHEDEAQSLADAKRASARLHRHALQALDPQALELLTLNLKEFGGTHAPPRPP
ncbi:MAG: DUF4062 domain-containing protein [Rubrivivax sp.]|nr:DUF4062 domain-containing protein [Rubrivivax sp.]